MHCLDAEPRGRNSWKQLMEATHGMLAINLMRPSGLLKRWCDRPHRNRFGALHVPQRLRLVRLVERQTPHRPRPTCLTAKRSSVRVSTQPPIVSVSFEVQCRSSTIPLSSHFCFKPSLLGMVWCQLLAARAPSHSLLSLECTRVWHIWIKC